jgi:hypothetical protein
VSGPIAAYDRSAEELNALYERVPFEETHSAALDLVAERRGLVLDMGASSGRDASWFASRGWDVVAAEPAEGMRREALRRHGRDATVRWLNDSLPGL